jgi:putative serine protease PepD
MGKVVAVAAATGLLLGGVGGYAGYSLAASRSVEDTTTVSGSTALSIPAENLSARAGDSIADIADRMLPTVVSIEEQGSTGTGGTGSGFIVREDGYIVTNNHVIEGAVDGGTVTVQFDDGSTETAEIVGRNVAYDLAVIKVDKDDLPVASIGNSDNIAVGDTVVALGSPLGLSGTVTSGIVSATNRPVSAGGQGETSFINAVQTDAAINPGNSGGPLVNASAEVIGVNSAIASLGSDLSGQAGSIGLGFAIPSNTMKRIVEEIIETGQAATPVIGVNLSPQDDARGGATVGSVVAGGPADDAGIVAGDVITAVNGVPTSDSVTLITQIRSFAPGEEVTLTVSSGSQTSEVQVTLGSKTD